MKFNILKEKFNVKLPEFIPKLIHPEEKTEFERITENDLAELKFQNMPNAVVDADVHRFDGISHHAP